MNTSPAFSRRSFFKRTFPAAGKLLSIPSAGLEPFVPSTDQPWDPRRVAHLVRRTGFGAPRDQMDALLSMEPEAAVDFLIDEALSLEMPAPPDWATVPPPPASASQEEKDAFGDQNNANKLAYRAEWISMMRTVGLREKMALFWSNHFVTQLGSYGLAPYMVEYLQLLRTHALGNFKTFTHEVGLLPAMLLYLNGHQNHKNGPNENYARELCELFTMGITDASGEANYSQLEITQLARALTGWRVSRQKLSASFIANRFDSGEKTFFDRTGNFGYDDVIDIIFEERTASVAHHICQKLYRFFVYDVPDDTIVDALATIFIDEGFEIAPVLRTLLKSAHFFDDAVIGAKIKSPIEFLQGLVTETEMAFVPNGNVTLFRYARNISQKLFDPPNVAGWPENHAWLSTGTMPLRWSYGSNMINGAGVFDNLNPVPLALKMSAPNDPYLLSRELADYLLSKPLAEEDYALLAEVLLDGTPDYEWSIEEISAPIRLRGFLSYIIQLPEYQLT